jgi:methyltransferase family protein
VSCQCAESIFGPRAANRELKRYRKKGATGATGLLINALKAEGVEDATLLDIGGGVGVIQHELVGAGAASALGVDAAPAYLEAVREEAERRGLADRLRERHGDFVELAAEIPQVDIATLDKVICCYPDMERLVTLSAGRADKLYGLVYPRDTWLVRAGMAAMNLVLRVRRTSFRVFVHPAADVERAVRANGFEERFRGQTGLVWQVRVYGRIAFPSTLPPFASQS